MLRIFSMFSVLVLHFHGCIYMDNYEDLNLNTLIGMAIEYLFIGAVNCFVIMSGFLHAGKETKFSKLIYLWFEVFFYCVLFGVVSQLMKNYGYDCSFVQQVKTLFPVYHIQYWFFTAYFGLMIFSPLLNTFVAHVDEKYFFVFLGLLFIILSVIPTFLFSRAFELEYGYSVIWFLFLYLVGAYIKTYGGKFAKMRKYFLLYIILALINTGVKLFFDFSNIEIMGKNLKVIGFYVSNYNQPILFLASLFLFLFFKNVTVKTEWLRRVIKFLSPLCFSAYLIHFNLLVGRRFFVEENFLKTWMFEKGINNLPMMITVIFGGSLFVFIICCIFDFFRYKFFLLLKINEVSEIIVITIKNKMNILFNKVICSGDDN